MSSSGFHGAWTLDTWVSDSTRTKAPSGGEAESATGRNHPSRSYGYINRNHCRSIISGAPHILDAAYSPRILDNFELSKTVS